ncbi:MAG: RnfABCDGE type electron transport complex subunit G [bacterium]|nr:RnfABCDGE type electron transport complex subunit G [bacterium]
MKEHIKRAFLLAFICAFSAGTLGYFYQLTTPIIKEQQIRAQISLQKEVLPQAIEFKEVAVDGYTVYLGLSNGDVIGGTAKVTVRGYGGNIDLIIGLDKYKRITGVRVLSHNETPGLGEKATKDNYLEQYINKSSDNINTVKFITGATISSRAIQEGVKRGMSLISKALEGYHR